MDLIGDASGSWGSLTDNPLDAASSRIGRSVAVCAAQSLGDNLGVSSFKTVVAEEFGQGGSIPLRLRYLQVCKVSGLAA